MSTLNLLQILCVGSVVVVTSVVSYYEGMRRGKDAGWLEHHFSNIEKDRARRRRNGQFKAKEESKSA
jgi:hypothetical protein